MDAKEIRIGNLFLTKLPHNDDLIRLRIACGEDILAVQRHPIFFQPIPLTIEWLIEFNFEYYKPLDQYRIFLNDVWYEIKENAAGDFLFSFENIYDKANHMPPKYIKYVHQLQNLYFYLSGEELTMKNKGYKLIESKKLQKGIKCLTCGKTSYSPEDIKNLYCGFCNKFH